MGILVAQVGQMDKIGSGNWVWGLTEWAIEGIGSWGSEGRGEGEGGEDGDDGGKLHFAGWIEEVS